MMVTEKLKFTDGCDSAFYSRVREKLDGECAKEQNEAVRGMMECIADLIGNEVRSDSDACLKVLDEKKTLRAVYDAMKKAAFDHMTKTNSRQEGYCMSDAEAVRIAREYYGITDEPKKGEKKDTPRTGVKSIFDLM